MNTQFLRQTINNHAFCWLVVVSLFFLFTIWCHRRRHTTRSTIFFSKFSSGRNWYVSIWELTANRKSFTIVYQNSRNNFKNIWIYCAHTMSLGSILKQLYWLQASKWQIPHVIWVGIANGSHQLRKTSTGNLVHGLLLVSA